MNIPKVKPVTEEPEKVVEKIVEKIVEKEPDSKNLKVPILPKLIAGIAGLAAVIMFGLLMLISPSSKDSIPKPDPKRSLGKRQR